MSALINLLAWRARRRKRRMRLWGGLFVGGAMAVGAATLLWFWLLIQAQAQWTARTEAAQLQQRAQASRLANIAALKQRIETLRQQLERRVARQTSLAAWEPRLLALAEFTPSVLWFTSLSLTEKSLLLQGKSRDPEAIAALQQSLRQLPGFPASEMGETAKERHREWRFSIALYPEVKHDAAP